MADDREDPLIKALPPATDYLTYLTLLEYQLTPDRLPVLHNVLQDETLTTNIGWDLVQLLLPMLPASKECLQDIARLGNPREVILCVSNALMKLESSEEENEDEAEKVEAQPEHAELAENLENVNLEGNDTAKAEAAAHTLTSQNQVPLYILQFNCLLSMLSVLHSRIKTRYPSRFVATSLQAALEAYTAFPSVETTASLLEFFRGLSGSKRPALPPRNVSESLITRTQSASSAPDPEEEPHLETSPSEEGVLIQRLVQFGLIEVLKTYLLHCTGEPPTGMQWAVRLQEKLDPHIRIPESMSRTEEFNKIGYLKERDRTIGKICALSRDLGLETDELVKIISGSSKTQAAPLDFENIPKLAADIPLERHGCLLLVAARCAASVLFSSGLQVEVLPVFPDIANIVSNFLDSSESPFDAVLEEPEALVDSLLTLAVMSCNRHLSLPQDEPTFQQLIIGLTACTRAPGLRSMGRIGRVPLTVYHGNPDPQARYNLVRKVFEDEELDFARESAVDWLREELIPLTSPAPLPQGVNSVSTDKSIFTQASHFAPLFALIYQAPPENWISLSTASTADLLTIWTTFTQQLAPYYLSLLNLYYFLVKSEVLSSQLQLKDLAGRFKTGFFVPLRTLARGITSDTEITARVEMEVGSEVERVGRSAAELVLHVMGQIEDVQPDLADGE